MDDEIAELREENARLRQGLSRRDDELEKEKAAWRDQVATTITTMSVKVSELHSTVTPLVEKVKKHDRIITGDSQPEKGMAFRTRVLEETQKKHKEEINAVKGFAWKAAGMAILAVGKHVWDVLIMGK